MHDGSRHEDGGATGGRPPGRQGMYDPAHEHDACGLGFIAHIKGRKSHAIVSQGLKILDNLSHRGATGADPLALTRALGLYATYAEDLFGTWLAQTFGAETSSLTRGITLWAKEVAVGVRDVLRLMDERGTLRLKDLRDDLRLQDGRDTLQLE